MSSHPKSSGDPSIAYVALCLIGQAIADLSKPIGTGTTTTELGSLADDMYRIGQNSPQRAGVPPRLWPEVIAVTEALIGAAFVVAQTHINAIRKHSATIDDINHVANYWKHRDDWHAPWGTGAEAPRKATLAAVHRLGATAPVAPGQLQALAERVLGRPFEVEALWAAIS
jgi:hypothetical protein